MYLDRIRLKNLRGFDVLDFSFLRSDATFAGWTVITGDNGSGKSTLLKAIALALVGPDAARALQPSFHRWIREGAQTASIEIDVVFSTGEDGFVDMGRTPVGQRFGAKLVLTTTSKEPALSVTNPTGKAGQKSYQTPQRSIWSLSATGWFSCGYGPFRRVFGASPEATRLMVAPTTERFVTMFHEAASLAEVNQWLLGLNHKRLERRPIETRQLDEVLEILRDDLLPNEMVIDDVDSDGLWLRDRNNVRLAWSEMSDGYRAALALLCDILRNMSNVFGSESLIERDADGRIFVNKGGIVLIDEVDAHLHPEWQREVGFWLKRHFPRVQFIVTSHSPLICQAVDEGGLFVLPEPGSESRPRRISEEERQHIVAGRPNEILLSQAFGLENTRSPRAVEARAKYAGLKAKQRAGASLSKDELGSMSQLALFVGNDDGPEANNASN